jgi:hypothetical protein
MEFDTNEKIAQIWQTIQEIREHDPFIAGVFTEGFGLSLNILREVANNGTDKRDVSEHLEIIARVLGFSLEDLVLSILEKQEPVESDKEPDKDTLDFITSNSNLDDYEKFLAENNAKDNLNFLSKEL